MERNDHQFWQKTAGIYTGFISQSVSAYQKVCGRIVPYLTKKMDVLELACGTGQFSFPLASYVHQWEATDFSANMIAEARKRSKPSYLHFSVQDATNLPYAPDSFDAVVIANALHIMPDPDKALSEIRRVLKPGGLLIAPTFVWGTSLGARLRLGILRIAGFHTYHRWSSREFREYISGKGFRIEEAEETGSCLAPMCCLVGKK